MSQKTAISLLLVMVGALGLHLWLSSILHVVEDESAYVMDAWQISPQVLPFREFGATKGPVFLFLLKGWQTLFGQTIGSSRLFTSLLHITSIPLLYMFAEAITRKKFPAFITAVLWGLTPAAVSLSTNIIHAPLELVWIFAAAALITKRPQKTSTCIWAAVFFFLAVLTRATSIAFLPMILLLIFFSERSWKRALLVFPLTGAALLAATIAVVYPLYGWPKTAFFFNADALLIADNQQAAYQAVVPSGATMLFRGLLPVWYEGFALIMLVGALVPLSIRATTFPLRLALAITVGLLAYISYQPLFQNLADYWTSSALISLQQSLQTTFILLSIITILALLFPLRAPYTRQNLFSLVIITLWLVGFTGFYRFWGRDPTPFYILESIPAFCLASGLAIEQIRKRNGNLSLLAVLVTLLSFWVPYQSIHEKQYRGTVAVDAAIAAGKAIEKHVPPGEVIFTAQPIYPFLGHRPLYKYLTHPGWYLAERAQIVPTKIRQIFFPDIQNLSRDVENEVNWIVTDWRTNDVYFKEDQEETQLLRKILAEQFAPIAEIPNDVTQPIILYQRVKKP